MAHLLASYGQWIVGASGVASVFFVFTATFLEFDGSRFLGSRRLRFKFFRWWRHELTAAPVMLDLCLSVVLLPATIYVLFGVTFLSAASGSVASMWYYALSLTSVAVVTIWRADAIMRAKGRERRRQAEDLRESRRPDAAGSLGE